MMGLADLPGTVGARQHQATMHDTSSVQEKRSVGCRIY
jgi:hypothetical protein